MDYLGFSNKLGDALIQGQKLPGELEATRLQNLLRREQIATAAQDRTFAAQKQPLTLEEMTQDNTAKKFTNDVNAAVGVDSMAEGKKADNLSKVAKSKEEAIKAVNVAAEVASSGGSPFEVSKILTDSGMPPQWAHILSRDPNKLQEVSTKMQLGTQKAELANAAQQARLSQITLQGQFNHQNNLERILAGSQKTADNNTAAMNRLLLILAQRDRHDASVARSKGTTSIMNGAYPKGMNSREDKLAFDDLTKLYPDKTRTEVAEMVNTDFEASQRLGQLRIAHVNALRTPNVQKDPALAQVLGPDVAALDKGTRSPGLTESFADSVKKGTPKSKADEFVPAGTIEDGYRSKGGRRGDKNTWEEVQPGGN